MSESKSNYIFGPHERFRFPYESIGKLIFELLKKSDPNDVINIDAITKEVLTCRQLIEDSIKIASSFKNMSIDKGDVVSIVSENTVHYISIVLAGLYMGVIINPLNPQYSINELRHAFLISKPKTVFCSKFCLTKLFHLKRELHFIKTIIITEPECNETNITIQTVKSLTENVVIDINNFEPKNLNFSDHVAFICLSSGTTGLPKGVLITHDNMKATIYSWSHPRYGGNMEKETTVIVVPLFHLFGVIIQLIGIVSFNKSIIMNKFNPNLYLNLIQNYKVKQLFIATPLLHFLAETPLLNKYDISSVEDIVCGAAPIGKKLHEKALERLKNVTIRQIYGLTEMSGACTIQKPGSKSTGNVGKILPNFVAKVINVETNRTVGPFEVGELCFKGPTRLKGYVGNEAATRDAFDEEGFCRTGDIGYYDDDSVFYVVDRIKDLIKYKGFQVAPAELEDLIVTHPDVIDCGVIGIADERAGQVPLACVVPKSGSIVSEQDIVDFVAERISVEKRLYGGVKFVDQIPKNPSGKILRRQLLKELNE